MRPSGHQRRTASRAGISTSAKKSKTTNGLTKRARCEECMKVAILNNGDDGQRGWERHFQTAIITIIVGLLSWTLLSVLDIRERLTKFEERLSSVTAQVQVGTDDRFRASDWRIQKERLDERASAFRKELDEHHDAITRLEKAFERHVQHPPAK